MDTRAETLEALSQYVAAQRSLLSRTQADIERLRKLRGDVVENPAEFLGSRTPIHSFHLTDLSECAPSLPENIDWSLYKSLDPTPLRAFTTNTAHVHALTYPKHPHKHQRSPLSSLQRFVKEARVTIIDPVLSLESESNENPATPSEIGIDGEEVDEDGENDGIDDAGKGKKRGVLTVPSPSSPARTRGSNRIPSIRINTNFTARSRRLPITSTATTSRRGSHASTVDTPVDTPATSFSFASFASSTPPLSSQLKEKSTRIRRPSAKFATGDFVDSSRPRRRSGVQTRTVDSPKAVDTNIKMEPTPSPITLKIKLGKRARAPSLPAHVSNSQETRTGEKKNKSKPETYKQAWSVSEQHLLERLLDEIPEGEKNRWQKISVAMQGRRTPRQVASRVQKYFEKLKRFGVGVDDET